MNRLLKWSSYLLIFLSSSDICVNGQSDVSAQSCEFYRVKGDTSEIYTIKPLENDQSKSFDVYCDIQANTSWILIQRRNNGSLRFDRDWMDYAQGFGDMHGEFWMGNENLHQLTRNRVANIRFDLWNAQNDHVYAEYSHFRVESAQNQYRIQIGQYKGTAGDAMSTHNNMKFSTYDKDNDKWFRINGSCSKVYDSAGWWFNGDFSCAMASLNGMYLPPGSKATDTEEGIVWYPWTVRSLMKSEIKINFHQKVER